MTDKYQLTATLVKAFFDGFSSGIVDSFVTDTNEKHMPQVIKRTMVNYYEKIAPNFHDLIIPLMAMMNFTLEEASTIIKQQVRQGKNSQDLLRALCGSEALYRALVEEYKRNFSDLLAGHRASVRQHLMSYTHGEDSEREPVEADMAIRHAVRMGMKAYVKGIQIAHTGKATLHQPSIFRILANAMGTLSLSQEGEDPNRADNAGDLFLRLCGSRTNFNTFNAAISEVYAELVEEDGIIAADDQSN